MVPSIGPTAILNSTRKPACQMIPQISAGREKYLALEKECEHYQATLSEMRVEIEYLRSQQPTSIVADPDLQRKAEKWKLGYTRLAAALKEKEKQYDALSAEKQCLECHLQERELYRGKQ